MKQFPTAVEIGARWECGEFLLMYLIFFESGGPRQRAVDYTADAAQQRILFEGVRGLIGAHLLTMRLIIAGQSFDGLLAMLAATRHPDLGRAAAAFLKAHGALIERPSTPAGI